MDNCNIIRGAADLPVAFPPDGMEGKINSIQVVLDGILLELENLRELLAPIMLQEGPDWGGAERAPEAEKTPLLDKLQSLLNKASLVRETLLLLRGRVFL